VTIGDWIKSTRVCNGVHPASLKLDLIAAHLNEVPPTRQILEHSDKDKKLYKMICLYLLRI